VTVIGVTGHQRIPEAALAQVLSRVEVLLRSHQEHLVGVCSLAAGADQLFAEAVLSRGGVLQVVIPCARYDETFAAEDLSRFRRLLGAAERVDTLGHSEPSEQAFLDAGIRVADSCELLVAIWDGHPARGRGGTADIVEYALAVGREIEVIWPQDLVR
jgi:hypothetical protein